MTRRGRAPTGDSADLGGQQVEGRRAVLALLEAGYRPVRTVSVARSLPPDPLLERITRLAGRALRVVEPERLAALARSEAPQGVVATAAPLPVHDLDALLSDPAAFLVALDGVTDPGNLGAVLRAAETAGATGVVLPRHRTARVTPTVAKSAAGAVEHLPITVVGGIPSALDRASRAGVWTVGLDEAGATTVHDLELATQPLVLVLGAEGRGLARLTRERCDVLARIPVHGAIASLNVAAAAAVACHAVARRRELAGG
jgi:23S rRNA (guanosine2251-2'-O)-methyltransferase